MILRYQEMAAIRNKLNRLLDNIPKRSRFKFKCYEKRIPGHYVQIDVKFLKFKERDGKRVKRFQYTVIDDCTSIRALKYIKNTIRTVPLTS